MTHHSLNEEAIFYAARRIEPGRARSDFIKAMCGGDGALVARLGALLEVHERQDSFLSPPQTGSAEATTELPPNTERPGVRIGPYRLLQQIGEGGMGVVFMAEQLSPVKRKVALKVIKPGMDSRQVIARFEAERQALAMMDHVNIARVFDAGATESGRPYFVMELVHGVPITQYCDENHLAPRERLELFVPVCLAIQHAHQKGIIHRDIKPSNVMVTLYDGKPVPKVIDFGVAKATEQNLADRTLFTHYGTMVGTLEYMSPEQAEMSALGVDTRSDIYSLGVLLYELLTGSTPLCHKRLQEAAYGEIVRIIKEEEPPRPSTRLSESGAALVAVSAQRRSELANLADVVRGELDWIVMKSMEKDRNRRYETANAFAADVHRYLNDEAVLACPPSTGYRVRKFVRRNKRPVLAGVALGALLVLGTLGTSIGLVRALQAEREASSAAAAEIRHRQAAETQRDLAERERDAAVEARRETFEALIDVTDFSDRYLLYDKRAPSRAEREFFARIGKRYDRLAVLMSGSQDTRLGSLFQADEAYFRLAKSARGLATAKPADSAADGSALRAHARRCRACALMAEKLRRWPEAIEFSRWQVAFARAALVPGEPPDLELFNLLLTGNWCLTGSLAAAGRLDEVISPWEEMVLLVAWSEPGSINDGACAHLSRIGLSLTAAGKPGDPTAILATGLAERRAKLASDPGPAIRMDLRRAYRILGLIHEKSRRFADALDACDQVIAIGEVPPVAENAKVKDERYLVSGALIGRAVCLDALGRANDADAAWNAVYGFTGRGAGQWSEQRMIDLARNGQTGRAIRMAEETLRRSEVNASARYDAACVFAMAAADAGPPPYRKDELARRALALLKEARTAGFFKDPDQVANMKADPDLDSIRGRDEFKDLLANLDLAIDSSTR